MVKITQSQQSHSFWSQFHKTYFLQLAFEHAAKFEKPKIVAGNSAIYLQHSTIHHHHISDCYFILSFGFNEVFLGCLRQLADEHDSHAFWIVWESQLTLIVVDIAVLIEFVEF